MWIGYEYEGSICRLNMDDFQRVSVGRDGHIIVFQKIFETARFYFDDEVSVQSLMDSLTDAMRCGEHYFELPSEHLSNIYWQNDLRKDHLGNIMVRTA